MYSYSLCVGITLTNLVMIAFLLLSLQENRNRVANRLLALFCLNYASIDAHELIVSKNIYDAYPILIETDTLLLLPFGPLIYLYVQAMTQVRFKLQSRQLIHLLPILVYGLWLLPFKRQPTATQVAQFHHWLSDRRTAPLMTIYYSKGIIIGYLISAYWLVHRHQRIVRQVLAALDQNTLQWVKGLIWSLLILYSIWVLTNESLLPNRLYFGLAQVGFSYWLAYFVMNQKAIYTHVTPTISLVSLDKPPSIRYRNSSLTSADVRTLSERVSQFMREEKPYLDKDLTLTTLADQLSLSPTSLSQVLNEGVGENFYSFVNRHRIEESKHLLVDPTLAHYSILGLSPGNTKGTGAPDSLPPAMKFMLTYFMMPVVFPLIGGMVHTLEVGAKRFVDGISDERYKSGVFYSSKEGKLSGDVVDQSTFYTDLKNASFQDNAYEAIHRFIK